MKAKTMAQVGLIERHKCMCGFNDRKCNHCGAPFEMPKSHCSNEDDIIHPCPRCGNPFSTKVDSVESAKLRNQYGLIP